MNSDSIFSIDFLQNMTYSIIKHETGKFKRKEVPGRMKRYAMQNLLAWKEDEDRLPMIIRGARQIGRIFSR